MKTMMLWAVALAATVADNPLDAQVRVQTAPRTFAYALGDPDRAMIGVSTRSSGKRDTLGLLVESVTRDGPADKAGIEEGDRIVAVNNVNLRLSPEDAGEPDMEGIANRRLIRELEKQKAGDPVELRVYRDGSTRTVRVTTVAARELTQSTFASGNFEAFRRVAEDRAVLGISLGGTGSARDTSGILIIAVSNDGPAAKAGIDEGDRIAAINGVDLRVAREDAGDGQASRARINRLNREMEKVKAGDAVELRILSNGQVRTVRVEAVKASEVRGDDGAFYFNDFNGVIQGLRGLRTTPGMSTIRVRPRIVEEIGVRPKLQVDVRPKLQVDVRPKLQVERQLRDLETTIRSKVEATLRARLDSDRLRFLAAPASQPIRRASAI
jgi:predicted metalloprotease with PDZ domain